METSPRIRPEVVENSTETLPSRDIAIEEVRNEINSLDAELRDAEEKVRTPGFNASATDIIENRRQLKEVEDRVNPRLAAVGNLWEYAGGADIEAAEAAVEALNFKSTAEERIAATTTLRDAKDKFYAMLQESLRDQEADETRVHDKYDAQKEASVENDKRNITDAEYEAAHAEANVENEKVDVTDDEYDTAHDEANAMNEVEKEKEAVTDAQYDADHDEANAINQIENDKADVTDDEYDTAHDEAKAINEAIDDVEKEKDAVTDAEYEAAHAEANVENEKLAVTDAEYEAAHEEANAMNQEIDSSEKWYKHPFKRLNNLMLLGLERFQNSDRKTKVGVVLGAVALVGIALYLSRSSGDHSTASAIAQNGGGSGGSGGAGSSAAADTLGGHASTIDTSSVADHLPSSTSHAHPYGWASEAFGSEHAMDRLKDLGDQAAKAGHKVEWHGSGTSRWVEVDGNSKTKHVIDVLRTFAK